MTLFFISVVNVAGLDTTAIIGGAEYHAISYEDVSRYGDTPMADLAVIDAVTMWNDANESVNFIIVESYSDSDVNITWERRLHDNILGLHRAPLNDDGRQDARSIRVRIGIDDCNYDYQLFSHDTPNIPSCTRWVAIWDSDTQMIRIA